MHTLTADRLRDLLNYDPVTGAFTWKVWRSRLALPGDIAGAKKANGYLRITIDGKGYSAHRLAWLFVHGVMPSAIVDHRDGVRDNNRITNLRGATPIESSQNLGMYASNTSGYRGVKAHRNKWRATLRTKVLGHYATAEEAAAAYLQARAQAFEFQPHPR